MEEKETSLRDMLREHINESNKFRIEVMSSLASIEVHSDYTQKSILDHDNSITKLESARNKQKGALWIISALGLTTFIEFLKRMLSH